MTTTLSKYNHGSSHMEALTGVASTRLRVVSIFALVVLSLNCYQVLNNTKPCNNKLDFSPISSETDKDICQSFLNNITQNH